MKVGIINVTGYAGSELARILHKHPEVQLSSVTGRSSAGQLLGDVFPHLTELRLPIKPEIDTSIDLAFSALPHKASAEAVIPLVNSGVRVVDISADFRLKDANQYQEWYQVAHPDPSYLEESVYGLTELHRREIAKAQLVANPGCYPTSAILALAPVVKENLIELDIIADSKSGVSGSGRGLNLITHFSEVNENLQAYSVSGHRHLPEITQELDRLLSLNPNDQESASRVNLTFLTHLVPMTRGILSSCYAPLKGNLFSSLESAHTELQALYRDFYAHDPFVRITTSPPQTKQTLGNNVCLIYPTVDVRTGRLIVISCLDNLVKGAAGQAIQNMNLMYGFNESTALEDLALYP